MCFIAEAYAINARTPLGAHGARRGALGSIFDGVELSLKERALRAALSQR